MTASWVADVRARIDDRLRAFLGEMRAEAAAISPDTVELVDAIEALTMRGGKRLRPVVLTAGFRAVDAEADLVATQDEGASIELLQSYLLIHDDWMDMDDERRGGPSVHAALGVRHGPHLGASLAILAGDLAGAYSWQLHLAAPFPSSHRAAADARFLRMQKEVYFGQQLDVCASPDVSLMHQLKTGSYTVRGPLVLGALLAGASEAQVDALERFGGPLGEAFQMRDDLLGTFGDTEATGKPAGNDLRAGKRTSLIAEVERLVPAEDRGALDAVFGVPGASDADVARGAELIVSSGARANVERRLAALLQEAEAARAGGPFTDVGARMLSDVSAALTERSH